MSEQGNRIFSVAVTVIALWYVLLCSLHLVQQRPLWNDEYAVFESVKNYAAKEMFGQPLMAVQVFPRLYLFLIQQFAKCFDFSLWSLRLPSFICMMAAFGLWLKIGREVIKDRWQYLTFVGAWPASGMLLYYSAELKQYSMDTLCAALYIFFLLRQQKLSQENTRRYRVFLVVLPVLGLLSYPAFILAMIPLYNLVLSTLRDRSRWKDFSLYAAALLVSLALSYCLDMRWRHAPVVTQGFGDYFISFASAGEFFKTFGEGMNNLFSRWFVEYPKYFKSIARIFIGFGFIQLFAGFLIDRKKDGGFVRSFGVTAFVLFLGLFAVGCLQKYPFTVPRTSLFYAPVVLCLTARGIALANIVHPYFYRFILGLYFVFLGFLIVMQSILAFWGRLSYYPTLW